VIGNQHPFTEFEQSLAASVIIERNCDGMFRYPASSPVVTATGSNGFQQVSCW
jgi:hypothetical protein